MEKRRSRGLVKPHNEITHTFRWNTARGLNGTFDHTKSTIVFRPKPSPTGGYEVGYYVLDVNVLRGDITAAVSFTAVSHEPPSSWEIVVVDDATTGEMICAGIGSPFGGANLYTITRWDGRAWTLLAASGTRDTLKPDRVYDVTVRKLSKRIELRIDGHNIASCDFDYHLPATPTGLWCGGSTEIVTSRFSVLHARPTAFIVMEFSNEYNQLYEHVIKPVCEELNIDVKRRQKR